MFLVQPEGTGRLDLDAIRSRLESIGESVLVAGDARTIKVHVHNEHPDQVIAYGLSLGTLSKISVENLDNQTRDVREVRAAEFTGGPADAPVAALPSQESANGRLPLAVVAVTAGDGLAAIFREFGAASVVKGGQSANPSTGELMAAIEDVRAREILLLPNNPNVVLAARQVAEMSARPVVVVPTRNAAEGYAALLALDPSKDAAMNVEPMTKRGRGLHTLAVTEAVRDASIGGRKVKRGQTMVLDPDDGLVAAHGDRDKAILTAMATVPPGVELVTLYYGDGADLDEVEAVSKKIADALPGVEVEVLHGGQAHYRYLISVE
jgi:dihydroxyacetone kinase-like predicted kinase